ncbi:hypothetical protein Cni_G09716 [Canna indica]|uniref:CTLH domain-containing protein n=1 Tax=Canna indica TaxID=4628 RepID=A0AAQ3Q9K9_9LILI|nr:hypothetical protein Cni_G09716 [Canna indica]
MADGETIADEENMADGQRRRAVPPVARHMSLNCRFQVPTPTSSTTTSPSAAKKIRTGDTATLMSDVKLTREEWERELEDVKIRKEDMNKLVMNFLISEGFVEAAEKFRIESGTETNVHLSTTIDRIAVLKSVQAGNVVDAIEKVNVMNPEILNSNPELYFHLQQQRLIELIRDGEVSEALKFAQDELVPICLNNQDYLEEFERTMVLLVFENIDDCPHSELLGMSQRLKTANANTFGRSYASKVAEDADIGSKQAQ